MKVSPDGNATKSLHSRSVPADSTVSALAPFCPPLACFGKPETGETAAFHAAQTYG